MSSILSVLGSRLKMAIAIGVVSIMAFGGFRIYLLEERIEAREARVEQLEERYANLSAQYARIRDDYGSFVNQVNDDLHSQRKANESVMQANNQARQEIKELYDTLTYNEDGTRRNYIEIINERPSLLESIINDATREVGNEFEEITRDRD